VTKYLILSLSAYQSICICGIDLFFSCSVLPLHLLNFVWMVSPVHQSDVEL